LFNELVYKWDLRIGSVYTISKAAVERSNPKFSLVKNEYSLRILECTRIIPVEGGDPNIENVLTL
jgi:ssDNA-binding replication factor A large subunit